MYSFLQKHFWDHLGIYHHASQTWQNWSRPCKHQRSFNFWHFAKQPFALSAKTLECAAWRKSSLLPSGAEGTCSGAMPTGPSGSDKLSLSLKNPIRNGYFKAERLTFLSQNCKCSKTATTHRLFSPFPTTCSDVNLNAIGLVTGVRNIRNIPDCRSRRNKGLDWRRWHAPTRKLDAQANLGHAQGNIGPVHLENKARLKQPCSRKSIQVKYNSSWSWSSTTTLKPTLLICCTRAWILQGHTQASEAFTVKIS